MLRAYIPILLFVLIATGFAVFTLVFARLLHAEKANPVKLEPYECGIEPETDARDRYSIHELLRQYAAEQLTADRAAAQAVRDRHATYYLAALGERSILVDCDVIEADGGTRTASITGGFIALVDCLRSIQKELPDPSRFPLTDSVAAVSVGIVDGKPALDLDYKQDVDAEVDMNVVMTGGGRFVEVQGTGEEATFSDDDLAALIKLAKSGIRELRELQKKSLGKAWPFG